MTLEERIKLVEAGNRYYAALSDADKENDRAVEGPVGGFYYGDRVVLLEDTEMAGEGEEGYVILSRVGAPEYGNERTALMVLVDNLDCPAEVPAHCLEKIPA